MTNYNWNTFDNNEFARLLKNTESRNEFARAMVEEAARRIDRAAQLEAELNEARAALMRYQDERVQLLGRIEELATRVKEIEDSDAAFSRDLSEALNSGDGVYRP